MTLKQLSEWADQLNKIFSLLGKVLSLPLIILTSLYHWLLGVVPILPRSLILLLVAGGALMGAALSIGSYKRQNVWSSWRSLATATLGGLSLGLAALLLYLLPPKPSWQRLDVRTLLTPMEAMRDFPVLLMADQLLGRNGSIPGGKTYKNLLDVKRLPEQLEEEWAAYYAPLLFPSTMPAKISLRRTHRLNSASLGIILVVWTEGSGVDKAYVPREFGYKSLQDSVIVPVSLSGSERASMFVFVYPWTSAVSRDLPDSFEEAISAE